MRRGNRLLQRDIAGYDDNRDATASKRSLDRDLQDTRHLFRMGNQLTVMATFAKELFRMGLLEVPAADFTARNMRCNRQDWDTAAVSVIQTVDQMEIARPAAPGTDRQAACQMRLRAGCKRGSFFMPHRYPFDIVAPTDRIGHSVEGVPCHAADSFHPSCDKRINAYLRHRLLRHCCARLLSSEAVLWHSCQVASVWPAPLFRSASGFQATTRSSLDRRSTSPTPHRAHTT